MEYEEEPGHVGVLKGLFRVLGHYLRQPSALKDLPVEQRKVAGTPSGICVGRSHQGQLHLEASPTVSPLIVAVAMVT